MQEIQKIDYQKSEIRARAKAFASLHENAPLEMFGVRFDANASAREAINSTILALKAIGAADVVEWRTADNTTISLTLEQLQELAAAIFKRSQEIKNMLWEQLELIKATDGEAELAALDDAVLLMNNFDRREGMILTTSEAAKIDSGELVVFLGQLMTPSKRDEMQAGFISETLNAAD